MSTMKKKIKISIQGASGYTGGELIRLLLNHPLCEIVSVSSNFNSGKKISDIHNDLVGDSDLIFSKEIDKNVDVIYLCSGHGKSSTFLKSTKIDKEVRIIDLSQDFRVDNLFEDRVFEYGLPEINKSNILNSNNIANPGCFATAIQLGVLPLISVNSNSKEIHTHAITGSTGAGLKLAQTSHFSWRNNNVSWYKPFTHQHLNEVYKTIEKKYNINFIPVRQIEAIRRQRAIGIAPVVIPWVFITSAFIHRFLARMIEICDLRIARADRSIRFMIEDDLPARDVIGQQPQLLMKQRQPVLHPRMHAAGGDGFIQRVTTCHGTKGCTVPGAKPFDRRLVKLKL